MADFEKKVDEGWKAQARREKELAAAKVEAGKQAGHDESDRLYLSFLSSIVAQAQSSLGLVENPMTRQREFDPEQARYMIDVLRAIDRKTKASQTAQEQTFFSKVLPEMQMIFVQLAQAHGVSTAGMNAPEPPAAGGPGPRPGGPAGPARPARPGGKPAGGAAGFGGGD